MLVHDPRDARVPLRQRMDAAAREDVTRRLRSGGDRRLKAVCGLRRGGCGRPAPRCGLAVGDLVAPRVLWVEAEQLTGPVDGEQRFVCADVPSQLDVREYLS